jgi:hypothetical protein
LIHELLAALSAALIDFSVSGSSERLIDFSMFLAGLSATLIDLRASGSTERRIH